MTIEGWLPVTGLKRGYFKTFDVLNWLKTCLLPALRREGGRSRVIAFDNCSAYIDKAITEAIEAEGHLVRFLPPYLSDFSPIELSFSVLKAWIRRNYVWSRYVRHSFGDWLLWAVSESRCDRYAREQYRHAAGGLYLEKGERERFFAWLRDWEREEVGEDLADEV